METPPRPTLFDFHGVYMTKYFTENWDNVQNFKARPDDIVIATYPKAGKYTKSQFFSYLLASLISCVCIFGLKRIHLSQEPHGSPASWTCCTSGRHCRTVTLLSLFMKECHFWRSTYPMDPLGSQVTSLPHYPDYTPQGCAEFYSSSLTFRAPNE